MRKVVITCSKIKPQSEDCDANLLFGAQFSLRTWVLTTTNGWNPQSRQQKPQYPSRKLLSAGGHSHLSPFTFSLREGGDHPSALKVARRWSSLKYLQKPQMPKVFNASFLHTNVSRFKVKVPLQFHLQHGQLEKSEVERHHNRLAWFAWCSRYSCCRKNRVL